ncbi:hypothetical protein GUJ93_ZPchr0004g38384 [Zizania palustris]|uniref:Uncharacterized protein n=1 Tax=Zizania palustris TaxID=103762 RepID=A0A8J5VZ03_ZIZPA|nr:hypothetical protein GUJ93_ZPchr0004g38384 [Zizania palustris]
MAIQNGGDDLRSLNDTGGRRLERRDAFGEPKRYRRTVVGANRCLWGAQTAPEAGGWSERTPSGSPNGAEGRWLERMDTFREPKRRRRPTVMALSDALGGWAVLRRGALLQFALALPVIDYGG